MNTSDEKIRILTASDMMEERLGFTEMIMEAYSLTDSLNDCDENTQHFMNFWMEYVPGVICGRAEIIAAYDEGSDRMIGVCIARRIGEREVRTLYVEPDSRRRGVGTKLLEAGFEWLKTDKPVVKILNKFHEDFAVFAQRYGWILTSTYGTINDPANLLCTYNGSSSMNEKWTSNR